MAKNYNILTDGTGKSITLAIEEICKNFEKEEIEKAEEIFQEVAKEAADELKRTSPKSNRSGRHYRTGWTVKREKSPASGTASFIIYNKLKPGLTFLLEHGHTTNKGTGRGQRIHIAPVEKKANEEVLRRLGAEL